MVVNGTTAGRVKLVRFDDPSRLEHVGGAAIVVVAEDRVVLSVVPATTEVRTEGPLPGEPGATDAPLHPAFQGVQPLRRSVRRPRSRMAPRSRIRSPR